MATIYSSPVCELTELKDIFIELTAKNCNTRCRHCYIDFPFTRTVNDFIKTDTVKTALEQIKDEGIRCIYLSGAEPMTHPDFNAILRLCVKQANVCICTNGTFINEKKARFIKSVESATDNKIFFKLSFSHWDEIKNDTVRSRGSFRQNIYALRCLDKYDFTNIVSVANYYKEDHTTVIDSFADTLRSYGIENIVLQVNEWAAGNDMSQAEDYPQELKGNTDCMTSRTLTGNGIFSCPFLANDYRGRVGSDFNNFSKTVRLETSFCRTCLENKEKMFSFDLE